MVLHSDVYNKLGFVGDPFDKLCWNYHPSSKLACAVLGKDGLNPEKGMVHEERYTERVAKELLERKIISRWKCMILEEANRENFKMNIGELRMIDDASRWRLGKHKGISA